jgi:hypothetical protein
LKADADEKRSRKESLMDKLEKSFDWSNC